MIALHSALNLGGAFIAARLNDSFRDIQQIIPFVFRLLMYVSGVMFPLDQYLTDEKAGGLITTLIATEPDGRRASTSTAGCSSARRWRSTHCGSCVVIAALMLWFGFSFFRSAESRYGRA